MEPFENEELEQFASAPQEPAPEPVQQEQNQSGYYHGAGVGHREAPFANTPYATYHSEQSYQPYQNYQSYQAPAQPPKEKKHYGKKILKGSVAMLIAAGLVVASSGITAGLTSMFWNRQYDILMQYMDEKVAALEDQIEEMGDRTGINGGILETPGETLTAGQIYNQNVNSVVALTCTLESGVSAGTGFVWTEDGYIITNHHVVSGAGNISVTFADGSVYTARLIGSDATNDVALIKVQATGLDAVTLGSSSDMQVGDQVVAIGNALGELSSSLTVGYVSGMDRNVNTDGTVINMLQTDVAINSGNSGGPLFNARGEVIGITTAKYSGTTTTGATIEGISFAIPMDDVLGILEDLRDYGFVRSAYLGVYVTNVDPATADYYGFPVGVYVSDTMPGYCAQKAGVQSKDIIVELGGYRISNTSDLSRALRKFEAGDTITVKIWRGGQEVMLTITLDERPQN